ncbi:cytochrome ubiquinol oxidase subunit I [Paraburkholderia caribensis]|jgi:cytochrome d ubiquinol oxidase subunit I|uniref:Cytochrome oxidase n=1 Tax=Paraburkholderia caribensis TaxID=75105 RepID=A0A9Q6S9M1_9BURK|nr:cytochrome ubiquinol oxidase subunit I [Paraburkholderia caribensis]AMV48080.1 cytochrome oxidase [Paraburkholderia caribensis]MCO4881861.1 cytochrome ubiquinol oxidase subunit I [Paraburkholderia caribensis]MDR6381031.1 cytochrome d ubiquinol oxidase subunit I [Paraburkholderia caribensis]PTB24719.1 cytochrome ubiquinol oxidase subunit I [Paraburkholderia caribensis]QLB66988.1 cytochrome oxidase [Paraburkholderia caribensis]
MLDHVANLSRAQFAMTAIFHILWPILTISLSAFLVLVEALWIKTGDVMYYRQARFWSKLLVLNFAVGVVSGIPMEFQFGTNWAGFSQYSGQFIGNILGFEGAMAFMLEAGFVGVMLLGWGRVPRGVHLFATGMVALGSSISAFWIMVANSWMQTPAGYAVVDGKIEVTNYLAAIFNPDMVWGVSHMWVAAIETGMFVIAGISAYNLFRKRHPEFFARSFKIALAVLVIAAPLQVWLGDSSGVSVFETQPAKGAAIEGHWHTNAPGTGASWSLLAWPDKQAQRNDWSLEVPGMLSVLGTHSLHGQVKGLTDFKPEDQPPMIPLLYYAFRVMAGIGFCFMLLAFWTVYALRKARGSLDALLARRKLLLAWVLCIPLPYVAVEAGWIVREVGRQPWVVYGLLRTSQAASTVAPSSVSLSMAMFFAFYVVLLVTFFVLARRWLRTGPDLTSVPPAIVTARAASTKSISGY